MSEECAFSRLHPITLILWFSLTLSVTVLTVNPIFAVLSLVGALLHRLTFSDDSPSKRSVITTVLFMLTVSLLNPLFSHHGVTVMFFLRGLPVTLEALLYGMEMSVMITAAVFWCGSLSRCMTSDKVTYILGSIFPGMAVLFSLTLRLVPSFKEKFKRLCDAQGALGLFDDDSIYGRIKAYLSVFSALVTMVLEDSIDAADSMKARGIELKGRTFYSDFKFRRADAVVSSLVLFSAAYLILTVKNGSLDFSFYPVIAKLPDGLEAILSYMFFAVIMFIPAVMEVVMWKRLSLKR